MRVKTNENKMELKDFIRSIFALCSLVYVTIKVSLQVVGIMILSNLALSLVMRWYVYVFK